MPRNVKRPREPAVLKASKGLEAEVKKAVKEVLDGLCAFQTWPVPTGLGSAQVDCYACVPVKFHDVVVGLFIAIETKREGLNTATKRQEHVLDRVASAFGVPLLISTTDKDAIEALIMDAAHDRLRS